MNAVMAFAPGPERTGWAMLNERGEVVACGELLPEDLPEGIDYLIRTAHVAGATLQAVVERLPAGPLCLDLEFARRTIAEWTGVYDIRTFTVAPSDWRRSRAAASFAFPQTWASRPLGERQRDALALAAYFIKPGPQLRAAKRRLS